MKTLIILLFILMRPMLILAQDTLTCSIQVYDIPFDIKDDPNIIVTFPTNYIPLDSKGIAIAPVLVDEKGYLVKYYVQVIRIKDTTGNNALVYYNEAMSLDSIHKDSREVPIEKYPYYVRFVVEEIYKKINQIKFTSNKKETSKKLYTFSVIFRIK